MVRHEEITTGTPVAAPDAARQGPRDVREAAFARALIAMREDEPAYAEKIVPYAGYAALGLAGLVALAAVYASVLS